MKKITVLLTLALVLFLLSCDNKTNYIVSYPDDSLQFSYFLHTNSIDYNKDGSISFVPIEDSTNTYTLYKNYTVEKVK